MMNFSCQLTFDKTKDDGEGVSRETAIAFVAEGKKSSLSASLILSLPPQIDGYL